MQLRASWKPWNLPPDISELGAYVGTGGFDFPDWAGRFYPPSRQAGASRQSNGNVTSKDAFAFYQKYFSFLELGQTFTQEPQLQQFVELECCSKASMRFSVKVHGDISHKGIWNAEQGKSLMRKYVEAVSPLKDSGRFYSFLIQLEHGIERNRQVLDYLLDTASTAVSAGRDVHIEFRNRTWHQESVLQALKDAGVGICNTEIPNLPQAFPLKAYVTSNKAYVRYHGLNLSARHDYLYSQAELEKRLRGQLALLKKVETAAIVFTNHFGAQGPLNALQTMEMLFAKLGPKSQSEKV